MRPVGPVRGALSAVPALAQHRRQLRLPGLSSLLNAKPQAHRQCRWQRVVQHPQTTIYGVVADVESYSEFLPWCMSSQVRERGRDAEGHETLKTEIGVGFSAISSQFRSEVTLAPFTRVHAVSESNEFINHLSFTWEFAPLGERACRLDLILGASAQPLLSCDRRPLACAALPPESRRSSCA
jgi:ribosome-associated toxin RatA of RatAB toxin-antitoxin module